MIGIKAEYCTKENNCLVISFCPAGAVTHVPGELPEVDNQKCTNCNKCVQFCPAFFEIPESAGADTPANL
ncbi:MAG: ferredoxin [Candidatus Cloacimonetes bacterium]|nr:ferredoxin [Candidatus Cloacimonadota bacterium]